MFEIFNALHGSEKKKEVISDLLSTNAPHDVYLTNQELEFLQILHDIVEDEQKGLSG